MPHDAKHMRLGPADTRARIALAVAAAVLIWLVLTRTFAAYLATVAPASALIVQPHEPTALVARAEADLDAALRAEDGEAAAGRELRDTLNETDVDRLTGFARLAEQAMKEQVDPPPAAPENDGADLSAAAQPPGSAGTATPAPADLALSEREAAPVRALAAKAVAADPINADAVGLLARIAALTGRGDADPLMRHTARLSFRESYALYHLMRKAESDGDVAALVGLADHLLRTRATAGPFVVPLIARLADTPGQSSALVAAMAHNPPWRSAFLQQLTGHVTDARTPLYLLLALQSTPNPPTPAEQASYIQFLIRRNYYELAYYTWLQFQPREDLATIGPLFNRRFDKPISGLPFDWSLPRTGTAVAEIRSRPGSEGDPALVVEFAQGRAAFAGVSQTTLAAPGPYVLTGRYRGRLIGTRGLAWRVLCADGSRRGPLLGQSLQILGDAPDWREFTLSFTVPPTGCRAQEVRLDLDARSASEKLVTGSMWFDDLELRRDG